MSRAEPARGQPVVAMVLMLGAWVAVRAVMLEAGNNAPVPPAMRLAGTSPAASAPIAGQSLAALPSRLPVSTLSTGRGEGADHSRAIGRNGAKPGAPGLVASAPLAAAAAGPLVLPVPPAPRPLAVSAPAPLQPPAFEPVAPAQAGAHLALWMAAVGHLPMPRLAAAAPAPGSRTAHREDVTAQPRWSADGWLLLRQGSSAALAHGPAGPTYGASQAGAVLRYRLAPASPHRPAAFLRATAALNGADQREVAAGLAARPVARLPVILAAELRATGSRGSMRLRPAISAVTELPGIALPGGLRGEAYGQAGWVGGRGATAFVDGQLHIDRAVAAIGPAELRAGAAAWGGAQQGAARLDIGPAARLGFRLTPTVAGRLGLDWRLRVAGRAAPASGPAITLSAGF